MPYRVSIFEEIAQLPDLELTLAHPDEKALGRSKHYQEKLFPVKKIKGFTIHQESLLQFCNSFDIVIAMFDLKWLSHMRLALARNRKFKLVFWGIGVSTQTGFDLNKRFDRLRYFFAKKADALLFYSSYAREKYIKAGFPDEKIFVAPNSISGPVVASIPNHEDRINFVFIGKLTERKNIDELLLAFHLSLDTLPAKAKLYIIGDGNLKEDLVLQANQLNLNSRIEFTGNVSDLNRLGQYFSTALACISPGQAGLSVLRSFSFAVPFICQEDAITGGERHDIIHGENGFLYKGGAAELSEVIKHIYLDRVMAGKLSNNALKYYQEHRLPEHMVDGFKSVIYYCNNPLK